MCQPRLPITVGVTVFIAIAHLEVSHRTGICMIHYRSAIAHSGWLLEMFPLLESICVRNRAKCTLVPTVTCVMELWPDNTANGLMPINIGRSLSDLPGLGKHLHCRDTLHFAKGRPSSDQ